MLNFILNLSLLIVIILILYRLVSNYNNNPKRRVKFNDDVERINYELKENFEPTEKQSTEAILSPANNLNQIQQKLFKTYNEINPSNFYVNEYNTPNFTTNVEDLRKFYAYDLPPNPPEKTLPIPVQPFASQNIEKFNNQNNPISNDMIVTEQKQNVPWYTKEKQTPSGLEYESDYWVYNNEMPMNGGLFGNIVGYENMGDSFSLFYNKNSMDIVEEQEKTLKKDDDLRNGMGTPQKQKYLYNQSNP